MTQVFSTAFLDSELKYPVVFSCRIKFEERTERGITENRKIECMVEQLRTQVQERDVTIHELQKTMDTPPARPRPQIQTLPKRHKEKPLVSIFLLCRL